MKRLFCMLIGGLVLGALCLFSATAFAGNLVMNGSTTVLPFAQLAAERFMAQHPDVKISVSGGGSGNGIKALVDGTTEIANSSRAIKDSEVEQAKAKGVVPHETAVALDCIVPMVHPDNPVKDLTREQLRDIYTGKVENWKEVGGEDKPIVVVGRDSSSGTAATWQEMVVEYKHSGDAKPRVIPRAQISPSSGAMLAAVAGNKYAIGYDGIGYLNKSIKALSVEGVKATPETAANGKFPLSRKLFMYTNGAPKGDAAAFLKYLLSKDGQKIVAETGFVPVTK